MRIAVSDYDGTLFINGSVSDENVTAITKWRHAGNLFGIATGRDLSLAIHGINHWHIPFDFLVCLNGSVLYDENLRLLQSTNIPDNLIKDILMHPAADASMHYQLCSDGINKIYIRSDDSYFIHLSIEHEMLTFEECLRQINLQQISFAYKTVQECATYAASLVDAFRDQLCFNINNAFIDINSQGVNKLVGVMDIIGIKGWPPDGLLAIGDGENDIALIRHFAGFTLSHANNKVKNAAVKVYNSVADMLTDYIEV
jgi:HAD superfamily hydrolase (TIGR01484 family)